MGEKTQEDIIKELKINLADLALELSSLKKTNDGLKKQLQADSGKEVLEELNFLKEQLKELQKKETDYLNLIEQLKSTSDATRQDGADTQNINYEQKQQMGFLFVQPALTPHKTDSQMEFVLPFCFPDRLPKLSLKATLSEKLAYQKPKYKKRFSKLFPFNYQIKLDANIMRVLAGRFIFQLPELKDIILGTHQILDKEHDSSYNLNMCLFPTFGFDYVLDDMKKSIERQNPVFLIRAGVYTPNRNLKRTIFGLPEIFAHSIDSLLNYFSNEIISKFHHIRQPESIKQDKKIIFSPQKIEIVKKISEKLAFRYRYRLESNSMILYRENFNYDIITTDKLQKLLNVFETSIDLVGSNCEQESVTDSISDKN